MKLPDDLARSYPHVYSYVAEHGRWFESHRARRPPKYRDRACFYNASILTWDRRYKHPLVYCEGFAFRGICTHHAWCIDDLGGVVDPTWRPTGLAYFGVALDEMTVATLVAEGAYAGGFVERLAGSF
ncbi:MAG: hypothetical protein H0U16_11855 [Actinobacteria bacterium]|nr:hypothetical protein [Actinomycetota bacterium]